MTRRKRWLLAGLVAVTAAIALSLWLVRDPTGRFLERRSRLAHIEEADVVREGDYTYQEVRLTAANGLQVDLSIKRAVADSGRRIPLVLVLGGHRTGRHVTQIVGATAGTVLAGMSYPYGGDPRPEVITFLRDIPKIRQAFLDTPPAALLSLDYLHSLPSVDTARVEAVGVSLGAPFVIIAGALDERITRVWAVHGSGGSYAPLEMAMRRSIRFAPARWLAAALSNIIIAGPRLAPEKWVARIAPRPFIMVNAIDDERLPSTHVESLFEAAREPKTIIRMRGGHVRSTTEAVRPLVQVVLDRVADP